MRLQCSLSSFQKATTRHLSSPRAFLPTTTSLSRGTTRLFSCPRSSSRRLCPINRWLFLRSSAHRSTSIPASARAPTTWSNLRRSTTLLLQTRSQNGSVRSGLLLPRQLEFRRARAHCRRAERRRRRRRRARPPEGRRRGEAPRETPPSTGRRRHQGRRGGTP